VTGPGVIDLDAVRADTPGCHERIFLDSAGSSLPPRPVLDEVIGHLRREAEVGGYRAAEERAADIEAGYATMATLLGCAAREVAFTDSATRSWLTMVDSVPLEEGDRVLISEVEYAANAVALLRLAERSGARLDVIPSDGAGQLDVAVLREMLDERVRLVSLVHVPTNGGLVNPVLEVVDAAHEVGALVLLDACQSVGQVPVDMHELGVDMLSGTGRKWLRGPRGTGFLAVREEVRSRLWPRLVDHSGAPWTGAREYHLRDDARVFELWESGVAERLGLVRAARYALDIGIAAASQAVGERARALRAGLNALPGVRTHDMGERQCGIVTFTAEGVDPSAAREALWDKGVAVTVASAESSRIDMARRGLDTMLRASPHYFVSPGDLDQAVSAVAGLR